MYLVAILSALATCRHITIATGQMLDQQALQTNQVFVQQQPSSTQFKYGVIVDCGSSGTRAHIFRWPAQDGSPRASDEFPSTIEQLKDPRTGKPLIKRLQPGLANLADKPELASDYMHPVMDFVQANVPPGAQPDTPIFFLGTAGLRLLPRLTQKQILEDIARDLPRDYPNLSSHLFTRVISGIEEGSYQWLSINTFANRLDAGFDLKPAKEFHCQAPRTRRFGLVEMGGASVQISYELSDEVDLLVRSRLRSNPLALEAYMESQVELELGPSRRRRIFSATFLGFGSNNARRLAASLLVREAGSRILGRSDWPLFYGGPNSTLLLEDPCLPTGSHEIQRHSLETFLDQSRPIGYEHDNEQSFTVRLYGGGNFARCQRLLNRVLVVTKRELINCYRTTDDDDDDDRRDRTPCTTHLLGTSFVPFQLFQFLGLGDFYYTTNLMIGQAGQFRLTPILRKLVGICSSPYQTLLAKYPEANRVDESRVRQECFKATWMLTLLQVGFRMPFSNDFKTVDELNGQTLDWTTGAMIARLADTKKHLDRVQARP